MKKYTMLGINFFCRYLATICYMILKVEAKLTYVVATIGGHVTA